MIRLSTILAILLSLLAPSVRARSAWTHETLGAVWAAPLLGNDGRIYVGAEDGFFYAFDREGMLSWSYEAGEGFSGWPVWIDPARRVLAAGNRDGRLYFWERDGALLGKVSLEGAPSGRPSFQQGLVLVGTANGRLVAVSAKERTLAWSFDAQSPVTGYPTVLPLRSGGFRVFFGCRDGSVVALDERGARLWRTSTGKTQAVSGGLAIVQRRALVAATEGGEVIAFDVSDGRILWRNPLKPGPGGVAALGDDVVVGTSDGTLVTLDPDGKRSWQFAADSAVLGTPEVGGHGIVFGTARGTCYVLSTRGAPLQLFSATAAIRGGATLSSDGRRIAFGSTDRRLYVVPGPTASQTEGLWGQAQALKAELLRAPQAKLLWRTELSGPLGSGVALANQEQLLAGTWGNKLFVLDRRGAVLWTYNCDADIEGLPAMAASGDVLFGCNDGGFYGLKPNGDLRFRYPVNVRLTSSPAIARDGTAYFGAQDKRIYALTREGKLNWRIRTGDDVDSSPRIGPDGIIYVGSDDRHLYSIDPAGRILWDRRIGGAVRSRPALGPNGTIYVTAMDQRLHALTASGEHVWELQTTGQSVSSPAVGPDGAVYFGSRDHGIYAVEPSGKLRWHFAAAGEVDSHPVISTDGRLVFVGSDDGHLYALDTAHGRPQWYFPASAEVRGNIVLRGDGSLVFGTMDGSAIAIAPPTTALPASAPSAPTRLHIGRRRMGPLRVGDDGTLIVAGADGIVRAYGRDRWPRWSARVGWDRLSRPLLLGSAVYVTDARGDLAALEEGKLRFRLHLDDRKPTAPAPLRTAGEALILVGTSAGRVWAVTPEGGVRWFYVAAAPVERAPLPLGERIIVAAGHSVNGLDHTGHRQWSVDLPTGVTAGPVAVGGLALVADGLGGVHALDAGGQTVWRRSLSSAARHMRVAPAGARVLLALADGRVVEIAADGTIVEERVLPVPVRQIAWGKDSAIYLLGADGSLVRFTRGQRAGARLMDVAGEQVRLCRGSDGGLVVGSSDGQITLLPGPDDQIVGPTHSKIDKLR